MDAREDVHAHALVPDETVAVLGVVLVAAAHGPAHFGQDVGDLLFQHLLGRPARDIRGVAQVAAGDEHDLVRLGRGRLVDGRDLVVGSHVSLSPFEPEM